MTVLRSFEKWLNRSTSLEPASRRRRLGLEALEGRLTPTATLTLDFGFGFPNGALPVADVQMLFPTINGPLGFGFNHSLISLTQTVQREGIDLNDDGSANLADARLLSDQVVDLVRRAYEPFDVHVQVREATNLGDVANTLLQTGTNDAYVFVCGEDSNGYPPIFVTPPAFGLSRVDRGNAQDNLSFAFADDIIRKLGASRAATGLARVAAHEAGHGFGLEHTDASNPMVEGDLLGAPVGGVDLRRFAVPNVFSNFPLPLAESNGVQNAYATLSQNVGAAPVAFVSGTGAFDKITITAAPGGPLAFAQVEAFSDATFTSPLGAFVSIIDTTNGILVEGSTGGDRITIDSRISSAVTVRGGDGSDVLVVQGTTGGDSVQVFSDHVFIGDTSITFSEVQKLEIHTLAGMDTISVRGIAAGTTVEVFAGDNADSVIVGDASNTLEAVRGSLAIHGEEGFDTMTFRDNGFSGGDTYVLTGGLASGALSVPSLALVVTFDDVSEVDLHTGDGRDLVQVRGTLAGTTTRVHTNGENDLITVGENGRTSLIGKLVVNGGSHFDTLEIHNQADSALSYTLDTLAGAPATGTLSSPFRQTITSSGIERMELHTSGSDDRIDVLATPSGTTTVLNTGAGADTITVGQAGSMSRVGALVINGQGNSDGVVLNDQNETQGRTYAFSHSGAVTTLVSTAAGVSRPAISFEAVESVELNAGAGSDTVRFDQRGETQSRSYVLDASGAVGIYDSSAAGVASPKIRYSRVENVDLSAGSGGDFVTVMRTPAGTSTVVNAGAGLDSIFVGWAGTMSGVGALTVNGEGDADSVFLRDEAETQGRSYVFTESGSVTSLVSTAAGVSRPAIRFGTVETVELNAGSGSDTVRFDRTAETLLRQHTFDTFGSRGTYASSTASGTSPTIRYGTVETVELNAGSGSDFITVKRTPAGISTVINAGANFDRIDVGDQGLMAGVGKLTINGQGDVDSVYFANQSESQGRTYTLDATGATGTLKVASPTVVSETISYVAENVELNAGGVVDTFLIQRTPAGTSTVVLAGGGNDVFTVGVGGSLAGVDKLRLSGQVGSDVVTFDNSAESVGLSYAIFADGPTQSALLISSANENEDGRRLTFGEVESVIVNAGTNADSFAVYALVPATTINTGAGNDQVSVWGTQGVVNLIVDAQAGTDSITFNNQGVAGSAYTLTVSPLFVTPPGVLTTATLAGTLLGSITYHGIESAVLNAGNASDRINVQQTPDASSLTVNAGGGDDSIIAALLGTTAAARNLTIDAGTGSDSVSFEHLYDFVDRAYLLDVLPTDPASGTVRMAPVVGTPFSTAIYRNAETLTLRAAATNDVFDVNRLPAGVSASIKAGAGIDTIRVNLATLAPRLNGLDVDGEAGGDTLIFRNTTDTAGLRYTFDAVNGVGSLATGALSSTSPTGSSTFRAVEGVQLYAGSGNDRIDVRRTLPGVGVTAFAGAGNDVAYLGDNTGSASTSTLAEALAGVTIVGEGGSDTVHVNNQTGTVGRAYTLDVLTSNSAYGTLKTPVSSLTYSAVETLNVNAGTGSDTLTATSTPAGASVNFVGNFGTDVLVGPNSVNVWKVTASSVGQLNSNVKFSDVQRLTGGTAADTIDFSSYVQAVSVNLSTNTATDFTAGILGFEHATGGSANDVLIGNAASNVLRGGGGNDILLGMDGSDTLEGGAGRDLLIGGLGADTLKGGTEDDVLIGGTTAHDANVAALQAVLAEWTSTRTPASRAANIRGDSTNPEFAVRLNGSNFLRVTPTATVTHDSSIDTIDGEAGLDWIFSNGLDLMSNGELFN